LSGFSSFHHVQRFALGIQVFGGSMSPSAFHGDACSFRMRPSEGMLQRRTAEDGYVALVVGVMRVQLFATCLVDSLFPAVGEAVVAVLRACDVEIALPEAQTCCGQPAFNAGEWPSARRMARYTLEVLEASSDPVLIPSGSCAHMVRHGYLQLFADEPDTLARAERLARRTYEFSEFLVDVLGVQAWGGVAGGRLAYHPSCHLLRGLGVHSQPMQLLISIPGTEVTALDPECCGFGGVFSVDQPELSSEMLRRKTEAVRATQAPTLVGCDVSCLMHIEGGLRKDGTPVRCAHLAQILAGDNGGLR
jgi:L-lactate dehydrogenase complex protein LldE